MERYLGLVALGVVLFYVFRDPRGTGDLVSSIADANVSGVNGAAGAAGAALADGLLHGPRADGRPGRRSVGAAGQCAVPPGGGE
jgi:hypothetical protein